MRIGSTQPAYEVYCLRCGVSFPAGTRKCIHCGQRTSRERITRQAVEFSPVPLEEAEELEVEDELRRRTRLSPVALMWVVLLIFGTIYRACAGG